MEKRLTMLMCSLFLLLGGALAQTKISGTVYSQEDGQPIIGAAVKVVGTSTGILTNVNGQFNLTLPAGKDQLEITYLGYEGKTVKAKNGMRVFLKTDAKVVDEVVVVAYGTQKKSAFTGSATMLGEADLQKHTVSNVTQALQGAVPGLQIRGGSNSGAPGSSGGSISIRGINSIYSDTDPLIIVDGAPYSASLTNIPPSDIESISVLKDAASAALYGARGAGGVIIITTKKGKSREAQITVDVKWGANTRSVMDYDRIEDPAEYYEAYYAQLNNFALQAGPNGTPLSAAEANKWANTTMMNHLGYNIYTIPEGQNLVGLDGKLNPNATLGRTYQWNGETYYMTTDDWTKEAYHTALRQEYNVSANASNDHGSYYFSVGHLNEDGIVEYSSYRRTTARLKADYQLKKWAKLAANVSYVHSDTESNPNLSSDTFGSTNLFYYTSRIAPIYPVYVRVIDPATGQPVVRTDDNGNPQYDYGVPSTNYGVGRAFLQTGNPLGSNRYNKIMTIGNQINSNASLDILFTKNLKFNNTSTITYGTTAYSDYENALYGPKVGVNGAIEKYQSQTLRQNHVQTLTYTNEFNKHSVTAMVGHEWYETKTRYLNAQRTGGFSADIPELNAFATMSGSESYTSRYNVEGYFGNLLYNWDEKYYASASYRRDATSMFAKDHRWGSFWSVGAAWIISKEKFMEGTSDWLDQLKIKASIGQQGNDNTSSYAYVDTYTLTKNTDTSMSPTFRSLGNEDLTWETLTNSNIGLEFSLWKGRLTGSLDFYYRKTTDLLFWISIPESAGARGYYGNVGDIRNQGVELTLSGDVIRTKDFTWSLSANLSHNSSKILKLPEQKITENGGFFESPYWYAVDGPLSNYMTYAYAGVNENGEALYYYDKSLTSKFDPSTGAPYMGSDGQPLNSTASSSVNDDGETEWTITNVIAKPGSEKSGTTTNIGEASRYAVGSTRPKVFGGFGTTFAWKGIDVSINFDYQLGGKIYDSAYAGLMSPGKSAGDAGSTFHRDILDAWTPTNTGSNIPRWQYGDQYAAYGSDRFLTSASYLNFQSFNVGYTLPRSLTSKFGVGTLRIYASGENLYLWSKRKGLDPRQSFQSVTSISSYSPVRTISGGLQVTF